MEIFMHISILTNLFLLHIASIVWKTRLELFDSVISFRLISNLFTVVASKPSFLPGASEIERRLHQKLFQDYNLKVRPARYWEEKVMVRVGMTLSQLVSLVNNEAALRKSFLTFISMYVRGFTDQPFLHCCRCCRTRRMRRWRPTCSWIWYDLCDIRLDPPNWLTATSPPTHHLHLPHHHHSSSRYSALKWTCHLPSAKKLTRCFIHRRPRLVHSCLCVAPAN